MTQHTYDQTRLSFAETRELLRTVRYRNKRGARRLWLRDTLGGMACAQPRIVLQEFQRTEYATSNGETVAGEGWNDIETLLYADPTDFPAARNKLGGMGAYGDSFDRADVEKLVSQFGGNQ